jgi:hypothetical protein
MCVDLQRRVAWRMYSCFRAASAKCCADLHLLLKNLHPFCIRFASQCKQAATMRWRQRNRHRCTWRRQLPHTRHGARRDDGAGAATTSWRCSCRGDADARRESGWGGGGRGGSATRLGGVGRGSVDVDVVEVGVVGEEDEEPTEPRELAAVRAHGARDEKGRGVADAGCGAGERGGTWGEDEGEDAEVPAQRVTKIQWKKREGHLRSRGEVRSVSSRM